MVFICIMYKVMISIYYNYYKVTELSNLYGYHNIEEIQVNNKFRFNSVQVPPMAVCMRQVLDISIELFESVRHQISVTASGLLAKCIRRIISCTEIAARGTFQNIEHLEGLLGHNQSCEVGLWRDRFILFLFNFLEQRKPIYDLTIGIFL